MKHLMVLSILVFVLSSCAMQGARVTVDNPNPVKGARITSAGAIEKARIFLDQQVRWVDQAKFSARFDKGIWVVSAMCSKCSGPSGSTFSTEYVIIVHDKSGSVNLLMATQ